LFILAFPEYDFWWLAWVGLVPIMATISDKRLRYGFFPSFIFGIVFFALIHEWMFEIPGYKVLHHTILSVYFGIYFGIFGLAFSFISKHKGIILALLAAPFIWVSLEYLKANLGFMACPTFLLAHTQYHVLPIIQIASVTGAYGVSFLIVLVNSAFTSIILAFILKRKYHGAVAFPKLTQKASIILSLGVALIILVCAIYGQITFSQQTAAGEIKMSVLQGNIHQAQKWDPNYTKFIMDRYSNLTLNAAKDHPEIIVWPEAATPGFVLKNMRLRKQITSLIRQANTYFIIGSSEYPKFQKNSSERDKTGNTALFFSPGGKVLGQYLKIRLYPFGEYIPYEDLFSWPQFIIPDGKRSFHIAGEEYALFNVYDAKIGVVICWESVFPRLVSKFVQNGANLIVNITNEAWFGETAAPYQLLTKCVFRAVENRVSLARAANTGISCFIDPFGRITGRVQKDGKDIFVAGYLTQEITVSKERTFYTEYGDVFVYLCILVSCLIAIMSFFKSRNSHSS
jgi:apolipoprotein N-acyltransferase